MQVKQALTDPASTVGQTIHQAGTRITALISKQMQQVSWALQMVYSERPYPAAALLLGMLAAGGVSWAVQLVSYFPSSGLFWDITPLRLVQVLTLAGSSGLLIPMQVYVGL